MAPTTACCWCCTPRRSLGNCRSSDHAQAQPNRGLWQSELHRRCIRRPGDREYTHWHADQPAGDGRSGRWPQRARHDGYAGYWYSGYGYQRRDEPTDGGSAGGHLSLRRSDQLCGPHSKSVEALDRGRVRPIHGFRWPRRALAPGLSGHLQSIARRFLQLSVQPTPAVFATTTGSYSTSSYGNQTYNADVSVGYRYRFTKSLVLAASLGLGYARIIYQDGSVLEYLYLTAGAGAGLGLNLEYHTKLYGGILTLYARAGYTPTLDRSESRARSTHQLGAGCHVDAQTCRTLCGRCQLVFRARGSARCARYAQRSRWRQLCHGRRLHLRCRRAWGVAGIRGYDANPPDSAGLCRTDLGASTAIGGR